MKPYIKPIFATTLSVFMLSATGCAEANSPEITQAAENVSTAPSWGIQADASHIHFSALQEGETFTGKFEAFSGVIQFDPDNPETGSVKISIPLKSVDAGSNDRNSTLPAKLWFSAKAFPVATFTSNEITRQGDGFLAKGELTLKGKSLPIDLPFDLNIGEDTAVMTGRVDMDRTLWDVGAAPWDTDEWVSRNVSLDIRVTAKRL